jgi:peroxiredoxin
MTRYIVAPTASLSLLMALLAACNSPPPPPSSSPAAPPAAAEPSKSAPASSPATVTAATTTSTAASAAVVGKPAPDFALPDTDGKTVRLQDFRGKVVVLEWFNPECPFVRASHTKGSLTGLAKRYTERPDHSVVWLAIDSAAPGKQGYGRDKIAEGKARYGMTSPVLQDENGEVGHRYGATNTPHMFVIDAQGTLSYEGAIDNSPDGEGESPTGGKLVNYVADALDAVLAGRPVATRETKAYGCHVKYGP